MSTNKALYLITTGDQDGVGLEVTAKALISLSKKKSFLRDNVFFIYISNSKEKYVIQLKKKFKTLTVSDESLNNIDLYKNFEIVFIASKLSPPHWVFQASKLCMRGRFSALITAPLSKELIQKSGFSEVGHTEIFRSVSKVNNLYMLFVGRFFNVLLLTGHIPLKQVNRNILKFNDTSLLKNLLQFRKNLAPRIRKKPIAFLGVNPHAGEGGIIDGAAEKKLSSFFSVDNSLLKSTPSFEGPLVPDVAFQKKYWNRYSLFIATYHDQGLIPFKMIHGQDSGVHITFGLPFLRTSVDHGTAKDIFGMNKANPNSMIEAIKWALKLSSSYLP